MERGKLGSLVALLVLCAFFAGSYTKEQNVADSATETLNLPPKVELEPKVVPSAKVTDHETPAREAALKQQRAGGEKFEFQAEVNRLMDIIINSLYSNKDIFLRELISNASDALDKIRFLSLTDPTILGEGEAAKLEIKIKLDKENKILTIRDRGIGMTKEDLIKNLGTIAKSGTSSFLEQMQKGGDLNLIGQFGVGFYSVYLVADTVEVVSKHNTDKQWVWESQADGSFTVYEDADGESLERGTEIRIHLKDEASEYADEDKLKALVSRYSQFINFPISLWASKEVDKEVPVEEEEEVEDDVADSKDEEESTEEEEEEVEEEDKPKTKTTKETVWDWELLNDVKPVWLRSPKDVPDEDYVKFYQSLTKESWAKPMSWAHFNAEGDVEFKAILYIPASAPPQFYDNYYTISPDVKLYVRRVFISDDFDDLLPRYLIFLKGIVDSDTLPLNVSREMLQQHSALKLIKKKLVRKALDMIRKIAEDDEDDTKKGADDDEAESADKGSKDPEARGKYAKFWGQYGKAIKLGIIEDASNRVRLAKLLRVHTSKSGDKLTSLEEYVSRMKPGQKQLYFISGESKEQLAQSPFVEKLLKKDYEVIYFTDPIDEYVTGQLTEFDDKKFQDATKEDLKVGERDEDEKKKFKETKEEFKDLTKWWKDVLGGSEVEGVKVSKRLHRTPCVVVTSKYGWSANMERLMKAQAMADDSKHAYMKGRRTLEINANHPLIRELKAKVAADPEDESAKDSAKLIYETALLESGFALDKPKEFAARLYEVIQKDLGVDAGDFAGVEEAEEDEPEEPTKEAEAETPADEADVEVTSAKDEEVEGADEPSKLEKDEL
ncbi:heat shock protein 90 [Klebsormidium nitens]|uniref:Heat shock protein 90 n=1 Tax=Klebsormidium nitens TaxID=105231 RepID=A0A1Y1IJJ1_KLENI|nr:heat shock protein 90 [Klebsormidium nitens]|eukprot:GAQ88298.1 heat shock protein 90 [Klebsormidium nitens]